MLLPIKAVISRKIKKDGTSTIFFQYCFSSINRVLLSTEIAIPATYWNKKRQCVSPSLPENFGQAEALNKELIRQKKIIEALIVNGENEETPNIGIYVKERFNPSLLSKHTRIDDVAQLRQILYHDKHTRIEGLCSEVAFMEDVVSGNLNPVTSDFWFTRFRQAYKIRKIVTNHSYQLSDIDYKLLDGFASIGLSVPVSIVYFDSEKKEFREIPHITGSKYESFKHQGTVINPAENTIISEDSERDIVRLDKAVNFLEKKGHIKEAAIKRLFANCYLTGGVWDIDAFTLTANGQVIAMEVKQKFPTARNTFGLNDGQKILFEFLINKGIPVLHVILKKPVNDKSIHAIDLLTESKYTSNTQWLYTRFFPQKLIHAYSKAPQYTSIYGNSALGYSHIPMNHFNVLKYYGIKATDIREKLFEGLE